MSVCLAPKMRVPSIAECGQRFLRWARNLAALSLGLGLGLLVAEALVRAFAPQPRTPLLVGWPDGAAKFDQRYGYTLVPGFSGTFDRGTRLAFNALGLRDHEYGPKRDDEVRILSLGDSFAFGQGVELDETYAKALERLLQQRFPAVAVSVVNAGVGGTGTQYMTLMYDRLRDTIRPDFVLATFTAVNDVSDNWLFDDQIRQHSKTPLGLIGRHSHALRLVFKTIWPITFYLDNRDPRKIAYTIELLQKFEHAVQGDGIPYLMLIIPTRHQVDPGQVPALAFLRPLGLDRVDTRQTRMVSEHFARDRVPYLDLWEPLATRVRTEPVFFMDDSHTNPVGNQVIAQAVFDKIAEDVATIVQRRGLQSGRERAGVVVTDR